MDELGGGGEGDELIWEMANAGGRRRRRDEEDGGGEV
jgi:hypothetical protein